MCTTYKLSFGSTSFDSKAKEVFVECNSRIPAEIPYEWNSAIQKSQVFFFFYFFAVLIAAVDDVLQILNHSPDKTSIRAFAPVRRLSFQPKVFGIRKQQQSRHCWTFEQILWDTENGRLFTPAAWTKSNYRQLTLLSGGKDVTMSLLQLPFSSQIYDFSMAHKRHDPCALLSHDAINRWSEPHVSMRIRLENIFLLPVENGI